MRSRIAVIGLGYVGLPLALAIARQFPNTLGFDISDEKIQDLKQGIDNTGEIQSVELATSSLQVTSDLHDLAGVSFFIVAVPTPIDASNRPDLTALIKASEMVGKVLEPGGIVVYESTVYPGATEEVCGPILAKVSGLQQGIDFHLGYSPERINPGDKEHTLEKVVKIVAGEDLETSERVAAIYGAIVGAGVHHVSSIKVAEMAKVIENTQRDLNIALMNEIALICDLLGIRTNEVLTAANTKWNFLPFTPGLVGGHCIGVDPYYLTNKAEALGYYPEVVLAGRRINDSIGAYLGQRLVKLLAAAKIPIQGARIGILGLAFKENVTDIRNSRVPDIVVELQQYSITCLVHDPLVDKRTAQEEYGIQLSDWADFSELDAVILAVNHQAFLGIDQKLCACVRSDGVVMDVKSMINPATLPPNIHYWSL